jgi:hypothetical protein
LRLRHLKEPRDSSSAPMVRRNDHGEPSSFLFLCLRRKAGLVAPIAGQADAEQESSSLLRLEVKIPLSDVEVETIT